MVDIVQINVVLNSYVYDACICLIDLLFENGESFEYANSSIRMLNLVPRRFSTIW